MDRTCVILNPGARTGDDREALAALLPADWEVRPTERAGHARELARAAAGEGFAVVIAAGGDGTVNEVVNGLAAASLGGGGAPCLGVLPLGTGNDLVRLLGLPRDPGEAVQALLRGACRTLDLCELRDGDRRRFFVNVAAGGFSGEVDRALTPEIKRTWGPLAYLRAATGALSELEPYRVRLELEGVEDGAGAGDTETLTLDALNVVVANGRFAGGGLPIAPLADPTDGLLEVVVIPEMPLAGLVALAPRVLAGRHLAGAADDDAGDGEAGEGAEATRPIHRRCRAVALESEPPMPWNTDGELIGDLAPAFRVVPGALRVLVGDPPLWEAGPEATAGAGAAGGLLLARPPQPAT